MQLGPIQQQHGKLVRQSVRAMGVDMMRAPMQLEQIRQQHVGAANNQLWLPSVCAGRVDQMGTPMQVGPSQPRHGQLALGLLSWVAHQLG